ncbi:MAG: hypothetical protein EXR63_04695 [Dehalococcoidia bacterium]|nr:hypothetical protein [Dehalococcoidia bacterium]
MDTALGRVVVVGSAGAGKTVLGQRLAAAMRVPFIDLDALYWKPGWVEPSEDEFAGRLAQRVVGDGWVVAGNYLRHGIHAISVASALCRCAAPKATRTARRPSNRRNHISTFSARATGS